MRVAKEIKGLRARIVTYAARKLHIATFWFFSTKLDMWHCQSNIVHVGYPARAAVINHGVELFVTR